MNSWFQGNDKEIYSTHNNGKSVVVEISLRNLNNKIYKYMTSVYIDILADIVNECNNTNHSTTKMKPIDENVNDIFTRFTRFTRFTFGVENNNRDSNFEG